MFSFDKNTESLKVIKQKYNTTYFQGDFKTVLHSAEYFYRNTVTINDDLLRRWLLLRISMDFDRDSKG